MVYRYIAYDKNGQVTRGKLAATSEAAATELLGYSGYQVVRLQPVRQLGLDKLTARFSKVKPADIILFYRQLALLLSSGIPIVTALELLQVQTSSRPLMLALGEVISDLRGGSRLATALSKHPQIFSATSCRLLQIGEESGSFENTLRHMADHLEKELTATKSIKGALTYPMIAAVLALVVVGLMLTFVLPAFGELYSSMGVELPALVRGLISLGKASQAAGPYLLVGLALAAVGVVGYMRTPSGRRLRDRLILRMPLLGRVVHLKELARVCRNIALLFHAGLPITEVVHLTAAATGNRIIEEALAEVESGMMRGDGLSRPMEKNPVFLPLMVQMVRIGEETGELDTNLQSVARNYEIEAEDKTKSLIGMLQPALTIAIGGVVGLVALSLTSAMYSIYSAGI